MHQSPRPQLSQQHSTHSGHQASNVDLVVGMWIECLQVLLSLSHHHQPANMQSGTLSALIRQQQQTSRLLWRMIISDWPRQHANVETPCVSSSSPFSSNSRSLPLWQCNSSNTSMLTASSSDSMARSVHLVSNQVQPVTAETTALMHPMLLVDLLYWRERAIYNHSTDFSSLRAGHISSHQTIGSNGFSSIVNSISSNSNAPMSSNSSNGSPFCLLLVPIRTGH